MTVQEWIKEGCNYEQGVALFAQLNPKSNLKNYFSGDPRFKDRPAKLKYELLKIQPTPPPTAVKAKKTEKKPAPTVVKPTAVMPVIVTPKKKFDGTYPDFIRDAINLYSSLYKQRSVLNDMRIELGWGNDEPTVSKRKAMSDEIIGISSKMEILHKVRTDFEEQGIVPEKNIAVILMSDGEIELPNSVDELKKMKKELQTNNSKDRNLLDYQSKKALQNKKPMPEGIKRDKIVNRISARNDRINEIEIKLKTINAI